MPRLKPREMKLILLAGTALSLLLIWVLFLNPTLTSRALY
mgnify:CR=1 FL=1